jgi:hypothetical protein
MKIGDKNRLIHKIILRVEREERRRLIFKTAGFGLALAGSISILTFGGIELVAEASRSGFLAFSSLLFSDFSFALTNFSDFAFSIMESFPVFPAVILLSGVFFAIWSAARFMNEVTLMRGYKFSR